ncbi:hypothetical protein IJH23_02195 [Candidatus Saccharibacteria bacterium]|nr:hypothetical protein [Candidatus Saccharibacteria bacterium]
MAEDVKKNNKGLIVGICCGVVALIVAVVLIVIFVVKPGGLGGGLSDAYFVSDDTKYVLTLESEQASFEEEEYAPVKSHMVYYYSGEKITGMSVFYEYADEAAAKLAYDHIGDEAKAEAAEIKLQGKYVEIIMKEESYSDVTAEEVKQQIEFMEMLKNMNYDDGTSDDVIEFDDGEETIDDTDIYNEEGEEEDF